MTTDTILQQIASVKEELEGLYAERHALSNRITAVNNTYNTLCSSYIMMMYEEAEDKLAIILNPEWSNVIGPFHKVAMDYMYNTYGARLSGVNPITGQSVPQIIVYKDDVEHNAKMKQMILDTLPYMIPYRAEDKNHYGNPVHSECVGFSQYGIIERTLGVHGSISVLISPEKKIKVSTIRYGHASYTKEMDFDEGIDFIIREHYYGDSDDTDE